MKIEIDSVYTLKLSSGEELVTKIVEETDTHYVVVKPATLGQTPTGGIELIPVLYTADHEKKISVNKSLVSMIVFTNSTTSDKYIEAVTGIKPVTNQIILG